MGSEMRDSSVFLTRGSSVQFEFVFNLYPQALALKSQSKNKKPEELKRLDQWYHEALPKKIQSRMKDGSYMTHEELVQLIKWKLARGKWRPKLKELVTMNTPRLVQMETKKAIRQLLKKEDVLAAIQAMCNLKGVGPAMASAVLSAAQPDKVAFMSDECLMSLPDTEGTTIDYTNKEFLRMSSHVTAASQRLAAEGHSEWTPHRIEQAVFAHHVIATNKPELLQDMPTASAANGASVQNGVSSPAADSAQPPVKSNGAAAEDAAPAAPSEDSRDGPAEHDETTRDSVASTGGSSGIPQNEDSNISGIEPNEDSNISGVEHNEDSNVSGVEPIEDSNTSGIAANEDSTVGSESVPESCDDSKQSQVDSKDGVGATEAAQQQPDAAAGAAGQPASATEADGGDCPPCPPAANGGAGTKRASDQQLSGDGGDAKRAKTQGDAPDAAAAPATAE